MMNQPLTTPAVGASTRRPIRGLAGIVIAAGAATALLGPAIGTAAAAPVPAVGAATSGGAVVANSNECDVLPAEADDDVLRVLQQELNAADATDKVRLATFEAAWVESHANNLDCGDRDSVGVFQQRPSAGWGTREQILEVDYAVGKFLEQAIPLDVENPGWTAGQLAQAVQVSAFPDRYDEAEDTARSLMERAETLVDGGTPSYDWPNLQSGSTGSAVETAQHLLNFHGAGIPVDGSFGPVTADAVTAFQTDQGLVADGVIGAQTWPVLTPELSEGDSGDAVRALQTALNANGADIPVDGEFGPVTQDAVAEFRSSSSVGGSGVDDELWKALVG